MATKTIRIDILYDANVDSFAPDSNNGSNSSNVCKSIDDTHAYFKTDISKYVPSGAEIIDVEFWCVRLIPLDEGDTGQFQVVASSTDWGELTITYNNRPTAVGVNTKNHSFPTTPPFDPFHKIDLTDLFREVYANNYTDGFRFVWVSGTASSLQFSSKDPPFAPAATPFFIITYKEHSAKLTNIKLLYENLVTEENFLSVGSEAYVFTSDPIPDATNEGGLYPVVEEKLVSSRFPVPFNLQLQTTGAAGESTFVYGDSSNFFGIDVPSVLSSPIKLNNDDDTSFIPKGINAASGQYIGQDKTIFVYRKLFKPSIIPEFHIVSKIWNFFTQTFEPEVTIAKIEAPSDLDDPVYPAVALFSNNEIIVGYINRYGSDGVDDTPFIQFYSSFDATNWEFGGQYLTFSPQAHYLSMAIKNDSLCIVYKDNQDNNIYSAVSTNRGALWSRRSIVATTLGRGDDIALNGTQVFTVPGPFGSPIDQQIQVEQQFICVYQDSFDAGSIGIKVSGDGLNWINKTNIPPEENTDNTSFVYPTILKAPSGELIAYFLNDSTSDAFHTIFSAISVTNGQEWSAPLDIYHLDSADREILPHYLRAVPTPNEDYLIVNKNDTTSDLNNFDVFFFKTTNWVSPISQIQPWDNNYDPFFGTLEQLGWIRVIDFGFVFSYNENEAIWSDSQEVKYDFNNFASVSNPDEDSTTFLIPHAYVLDGVKVRATIKAGGVYNARYMILGAVFTDSTNHSFPSYPKVGWGLLVKNSEDGSTTDYFIRDISEDSTVISQIPIPTNRQGVFTANINDTYEFLMAMGVPDDATTWVLGDPVFFRSWYRLENEKVWNEFLFLDDNTNFLSSNLSISTPEENYDSTSIVNKIMIGMFNGEQGGLFGGIMDLRYKSIYYANTEDDLIKEISLENQIGRYTSKNPVVLDADTRISWFGSDGVVGDKWVTKNDSFFKAENILNKHPLIGWRSNDDTTADQILFTSFGKSIGDFEFDLVIFRNINFRDITISLYNDEDTNDLIMSRDLNNIVQSSLTVDNIGTSYIQTEGLLLEPDIYKSYFVYVTDTTSLAFEKIFTISKNDENRLFFRDVDLITEGLDLDETYEILDNKIVLSDKLTSYIGKVFKINIPQQNTPDGYYAIGEFDFGLSETLDDNAAFPVQEIYEDAETVRIQMRAGHELVFKRGAGRRIIEFTFDVIDKPTRDLLRSLYNATQAGHKPVWLIIDHDAISGTLGQHDVYKRDTIPILMRLSSPSDFQTILTTYSSGTLTFEEVISE